MALLQPMPYVILREFDDLSKELSGGTIEFFQSSTDTHLATYKDAAGTIANLNPLPLDQGGSAVVFLQSGVAYDIVVKDSLGTQIRKLRGISVGLSGSEGTSTIVANYDALRNLSDDYDIVFIQGRTTTGDGGEGWFERIPSFSASDDDGVCLLRGSSSRYKRLTDGRLLPVWYGVKYGTTIDQTLTFSKSIIGARAWGMELAISGKVYLTQDLHLTCPVRILQGGGFYGSGTVYFDTGSQLIECSSAAFASTTGTTPVYFAGGTTSIVNPAWFDTGDDNKLAFADASTASKDLWPTTGLSLEGWGPVNHQHTPGNILPLSGTLGSALNQQAADIKFSLTRPDTIEFGNGNWTITDGWSLQSSDVSSYIFQRAKSGGLTPITLPTSCKVGLLYTVTLAIVNEQNDQNGNNVGTFTVSFGGTTIGESSSAGTSTISASFTPDTSNPSLVITPTQHAYGYVTGVSITCDRAIHDNRLLDASYAFDGNWAGSAANGFTHNPGSAGALSGTITPNLVAGHKYKGSFSLTRPSAPTTNLLLGVAPSVNSQFSGSTSSGFQLTSWAVGTYDVSWTVPTTPGTQYTLTPTYSGSPQNDVNGSHSYQYADTKSVGLWAGGMPLQDDLFGYKGNAARTFIATASTTIVTLRIVCAQNSVNAPGTLRFGYMGNVSLNLQAVEDIGSLSLSVGGAPVTVDQNAGIIQKSGNYTFDVVTQAATNLVIFTPTNDFYGDISSLTLIDETQGSVSVYVGTNLIATVSESRTYALSGSGLTGTYVSFVPTYDFDGQISNISVKKHASNATVKILDLYTITGNLTISAPCDPWQGRINVAGLANIDIQNLINVGSSQWLAYESQSFVGDNNFGSTQAQPEWAGAIGDGAADDTIPALFALKAPGMYAAGQYRIVSDISGGAISITGPLTAENGSANGPGIKLDPDVTLTVASIIGQGAAIIHGKGSKIACSGSVAFTYVYYSDADSVSSGDSMTCGAFSAEWSTIQGIRGINNSIAGTLRNCSLAGLSDLYRCVPVGKILNSYDCSFADCDPFTAADGGEHSRDDFDSPRAWQMIIPSGATVDVMDCYSSGNLAYFNDATGALNVYRLRGIQDTCGANTDSVTSLANVITRHVLTNGIGIVNEWTEYDNPEAQPSLRSTLNGVAMQTWQPTPAEAMLWTADTRMFGGIYAYDSDLVSPQGAWYDDGSAKHCWQPQDTPTLASKSISTDGTAITVTNPGKSSWELESKAANDVMTYVQDVGSPYEDAAPACLDLNKLCFISLFGGIFDVTLQIPASLHASDELLSSFDLSIFLRYSSFQNISQNTAWLDTNVVIDTNATDELYCHKGIVIPKSNSAQTIRLRIPILFGSEPLPKSTSPVGYQVNFVRSVPKIKLSGQYLDGVTISISTHMILPTDNISSKQFTQPIIGKVAKSFIYTNWIAPTSSRGIQADNKQPFCIYADFVGNRYNTDWTYIHWGHAPFYFSAAANLDVFKRAWRGLLLCTEKCLLISYGNSTSFSTFGTDSDGVYYGPNNGISFPMGAV